ncbi:MAG TPA: hypothetical protein VMU54_09025 [Planctomycetota bacterium]|nr:hypothetical protein [Planctomycetota bacterium]
MTMAQDKFNLKKVLADNSQVSDLGSLASSGVRKVKVLDENTLQEMIQQAIDDVISSSTAEERSRILADSRKQLTKLMNERDEFASRASMQEAGRNDLIAEIEKLQEEIKLRRKVDENQAGAEQRVQELEADNVYIRGEHDKMVEALDQAQTEIKGLKEEIERLKTEIERLKALLREKELLQRELDDAEAEVSSLREQVENQGDAARKLAAEFQENRELKKRLEVMQAELAALRENTSGSDTLAQELNQANEENAELKQQLEDMRSAGATAASGLRKELNQAREKEAEYQRQLAEAQAEAERLKAALPPPGPDPIVVLPSEEAPPPPAPVVTKPGKGLDVGTVNLVAASQNPENEIELRLQRNVFLDVEITPYTKAMLTKLNVGYVIQGKRMYILGEPAFKLANVLNRRTRRPMADGLISPKEQDALPIMKLLIGSILDEPRIPQEVCFYSVPGDPVDSDLSVAYHRDLFDAVLKALGYKPSHILEGHAVTFAELGEEDFTGIGVSCGGGMFNVCVAYKSMPALSFSTARSGDWVDMNVAQALGIKPEKAAMIKEQGVDLTAPKNREEDAIAIYYRNLIQYNITNIAERFRSAENMPSFKDPISVVFSGGTSMAGNFIELVKDVFKKIEFPIPVKDIRMAKDPLNATAKGALVAAQLEMAHLASQ